MESYLLAIFDEILQKKKKKKKKIPVLWYRVFGPISEQLK